MKLVLNGNDLRTEDIKSFIIAPGMTVELSPSSLDRVKKSFKMVQEEINKRVIYGVNTGFGPMASHVINESQLTKLQQNLIRSHAMGIGEPIPEEYVLASMLVRLNTLLKGYSGVSPELLELITFFLNKRIIPVIPEHGAVGTSGDLVQLAHIALSLMGEGEVIIEGKRQKTSLVFKKYNIKPHILKPKEGLSLINGTAVMSGIAALLIEETHHLLFLATRNAAFALELVGGFNDSISEKLHALRPHEGQVNIAKQMREILASSKLLKNREIFHRKERVNGDVHLIKERVQDIYSLRCTAQVLGPIWEAVYNAKKYVDTEINAVTDNPIVDIEQKEFLHGGNFHGDYIAFAMDQLKMTLVKLTMLSERRIDSFLDPRSNLDLFPPFMNLYQPGLSLGLQGLQFVATSTTAQSQTLAFPQYVHSIPTNGGNQDIVSMGTDAALLTAKVLENAYVVVAIELITLAQGVDYLNTSLNLSVSSQELFKKIRKILPKIEEDRELYGVLDELIEKIKTF